MKRIVFIILSIAMILTLCGCVSKQEASDYIVNFLVGYHANLSAEAGTLRLNEKIVNSKAFEEVAVEFINSDAERIDDYGNYSVDWVGLIRNLDKAGYTNDAVREAFIYQMEQKIEAVKNGEISFFDYYRIISGSLELKRIAIPQDFIPYDDFKNLLTGCAEILSLDEGYYTGREDEYSSYARWSDPLGTGSKGGEIGTYFETKGYAIFGDFLTSSESKQFAQTQANDYGNYSSVVLFVADGTMPILVFEDEIKDFLETANQGSIYGYVELFGDSVHYYVFVVGDDFICFANPTLNSVDNMIVVYY